MADPSSRQPAHRKVTRSRLGCETCRARKVRCDERRPSCFNCERLGLVCAGPSDNNDSKPAGLSPGTPEQDFAGQQSSGLKRKRTYRSCKECRLSKTRCSGTKPLCGRCLDKKIVCTYEDETEPAWKQRVVALPQRSSSGGKKNGVSSPLLDSPGMAVFTPTSTNPSRRPSINHGVLGSPSALPPSSSNHNDDLSWLVIPPLPDHSRMRILAER